MTALLATYATSRVEAHLEPFLARHPDATPWMRRPAAVITPAGAWCVATDGIMLYAEPLVAQRAPRLATVTPELERILVDGTKPAPPIGSRDALEEHIELTKVERIHLYGAWFNAARLATIFAALRSAETLGLRIDRRPTRRPGGLVESVELLFSARDGRMAALMCCVEKL